MVWVNHTRIFFIVLSLFFAANLFSQNPDRPKKTFTVNIAKKDTTIKADVLSDNSKIKPDENLTYNWFASNKILETKGGYDGHLLHGSYTSFYGNNNLRQKGKFKKGLKEGKWIAWFINGKINEITHWKHGMKNGKYSMYNGEGKIMVETKFRKDKLNGTMTSYQDEKILSKRKYKNGLEIILKEKLPKVKNGKQPKEKSSAKTPLKEKIKKLFKKKDKSKKDKTKEKPKAQVSKS